MARYKLLDVMQEKDYNVRKLAWKLDCTEQTIDNWVKGKHRPNEYGMRKLAELFGMPVEQIVGIFWEG